ncbi:MAG: CapA family protein [Nitrososphaerales archaeon]
MVSRYKFIFVIAISVVTVAVGTLLLLSYPLNNDVFQLSKTGITVIAVGDSIGYKIDSENLSHLANMISDTDIFIFNLEGALFESDEDAIVCEKFPRQSLLTANSAFVEYLKLAPITIANMANNHVLDCGSEGIERTKRILTEYDILSVGAGQALDEACEPLLIKFKDWHIALLSYNFVIADRFSAAAHKAGAASLDSCQHDIGKLRSQGVDLIVASMHEGIWSDEVLPGQVQLVTRLFESGVDIVIGHSPHMPQAIMAKDGKIAFFSLGNFIFRPDYQMPSLAHTTIVPRIDFHADRIDVTIYPVRIDNDGIPHRENNKDIIARISEASKEFNTVIHISDNLGHISISRR